MPITKSLMSTALLTKTGVPDSVRPDVRAVPFGIVDEDPASRCCFGPHFLFDGARWRSAMRAARDKNRDLAGRYAGFAKPFQKKGENSGGRSWPVEIVDNHERPGRSVAHFGNKGPSYRPIQLVGDLLVCQSGQCGRP